MRKTYSQEERMEALKLAEEIGTTAAGQRLGINPNTIFNWRSRMAKKEVKRAAVPQLSEEEWRAENKRLKKELAEKQEEVEIMQAALGFFVKSRKK